MTEYHRNPLKNVEVLARAKLHHSALNSFLIEYEARKLGCRVLRLSDFLVQVTTPQGVSDFFRRACGPQVSRAAYLLSMNKRQTKEIWKAAGIPVSDGLALGPNGFDHALEFAWENDWNIVLKPNDGAGGKGVFASINSKDQLKTCWGKLFNPPKGRKAKIEVLIERKFIGQDFRVFMVNGEVAAAQERRRPFILGDGVKTVRDLINAKIEVRMSNPDLYSRPLKIDTELHQCLDNEGLNFDSVLNDGQSVVLRGNANLSTGGENYDITSKLSDEVRALFSKAALSISRYGTCALDVFGRDVDALNRADQTDLIFNEVETDAGMCIHHFPMFGQPVNVARRVICAAFPDIEPEDSGPYNYDFDDNAGLVSEILQRFSKPETQSDSTVKPEADTGLIEPLVG
jgi:cyanophycin synthetase